MEKLIVSVECTDKAGKLRFAAIPCGGGGQHPPAVAYMLSEAAIMMIARILEGMSYEGQPIQVKLTLDRDYSETY